MGAAPCAGHCICGRRTDAYSYWKRRRWSATVTAVDGETITLTVDRWYAGGDAETVILHADQGMEALIGGIDFRVDGNSSTCLVSPWEA